LIWVHAATAAIITVGDHDILADAVTPIQIMIEREENDPEIAGIDLAVQVADGTSGPTIGMIDLATGTPFETNNFGGSLDSGSDPRHAFWGIITDTGTVSIPESGLLATVYLDAAGLFSGTFDIALTSVLGVDTQLYDELGNPVPLNQGQPITGSVTLVVPEPASLFIWLALMLLIRRN
jgi:hypothetical protein